MPIDYFAHEYYNSLQPRLRYNITNAKISLLPDVNLSFSGTADEKLTDKTFNTKYGAEVLKKYNLVDEAKFNGEDEWLQDDDADVEDNEYSDDLDENAATEDDVLMSTRQNTLAAQLAG
jgi:hypothetical protein